MSNDVVLGIRLTTDGFSDAKNRIAELAAGFTVASVATKGLEMALQKVGDVLDYLKDSALAAARYETLGVAMVVVGKNANYTAAQLEAVAIGLQHTGISMLESRQATMQLVQAHIDLSQASGLARIAQDAAVIGNMNSSEAFAALVHGVQSAQVEVLRTIGINVSFEDGYKKLAATLGKTAESLTDNEKTQARLNLVIDKGRDIAGTYEAAMDTAGKQILSMRRYTEDLKVKQGEVFNEALTVAVMAYTTHLKDANGQLDQMASNKQIESWAHDLTDSLVWVADSANNAVLAFQLVGKAIGMIAAMGNTTPLDFSGRTAIWDAYTADHAKIMAGEDRFSKALDARRAARAEHEATALAALKASNESFMASVNYYAGLREQGLMSEVTYAKTVSTMLQAAYGDNHKYGDSAPPAAKPAKDAFGDVMAKINAKESDVDASYWKDLNTLNAGYKSGRIDVVGYADAVRRLTEEQKFFTDAQKADRALQDDLNRAREAATTAIDRSTSSIEAETRRIRDHNLELISGKDALEARQIAQDEATLASERARLDELDAKEVCTTETEALRDNIAALQDRAKARGESVSANAIAKSAAAATKFSDDISRSLTDSLMRGFQNGVPFAKNFADSLQSTLKTAVLKGVIEALTDPMLQNVKQVTSGLMGAVSGGGGLGGILSLFGGGGGSSSVSAAAGMTESADSLAILSSFGFRQGGVFDNSPSFHSYINGVYDTPQQFKFANGGVFAEAGPEAAVPLMKMSDGNLGVRSQGGGVIVNVMESPGKGGQVQQTQQGGQTIITVLVEQVKSAFAKDLRSRGDFAQTMENTYPALSRA